MPFSVYTCDMCGQAWAEETSEDGLLSPMRPWKRCVVCSEGLEADQTGMPRLPSFRPVVVGDG